MKKLNFFKTGLKICILIILVFNYLNSVAQCTPNLTQTDPPPADAQIKGVQNGYGHELWNAKSKGEACITLRTDGTFSGKWSGIENYLARRGQPYDRTKLPSAYGTFFGQFRCTYSPGNESGGNSYLGVYGWLYNPSTKYLVEYYIIENWLNYHPGKGTTPKATFHNDGSDYDVYQLTHTGPSIIDGKETTFQQYVSVRKNTRSSGDLSISNHFKEWEVLKMDMTGYLHEVSLLVEGYKNSGSFDFTTVFISPDPSTQAATVDLTQSSYSIKVGEQTSAIQYSWSPSGSTLSNFSFESSNTNVLGIGVYKGNYFLIGKSVGTATLTMYHGGALTTDKATVTVTAAAAGKLVSFSALGNTGTEQIALLVGGKPVNTYTLTKNFQTYTQTVSGSGDVTVEFLNDDGITNGREVRLDYISIDGVKRETEAMAVNTAVYQNGTCGGSYSEWLNCNGSVNYGPLPQTHPITIRARGNNGGEHIDLLINGQPVNGGWTLGTTFQEYSATVNGDGDIRVEYDNDGGLKDVVVDWVKVDNQTPRQAENMQYNTGFFANGRCGGGSYSEWMQCNGVIGFGKVSDNFNARVETPTESDLTVESKKTGVHVFPNPSSGTVSIMFDDAAVNANLKIYDTVGKIIYSRENIHDKEVQVSDLASGIYIVKVKNNGLHHKKKLIVR
jgi:hypothetical protein